MRRGWPLFTAAAVVGACLSAAICLKTGSKDADGWYAWGGNGEHNKNK